MKPLKIVFTITCLLLLWSCAKRGTITGGPKDTIAPVLVRSTPKNYETNFTGKEIRIDFSEYIKIKDVNKQLIISPPMDKKPTISPQGSASKNISIKLNEDLLPNTTYSFNFGQSITDFNEGNPYSQFKYVFSTGAYVDSLKTSGVVVDAFENKTDDFVNILLYDATTFKDSTIYKEVPRYVTNTLEKNTAFTIENIKEGEYYLFALKDKNNDFKYQSKTDKIGFKKEKIKIPSDSVYLIKLFKEKNKTKFYKPTQETNNKLFIGFEGDKSQLKITAKKDNKEVPLYVANAADKKNDTLQLFIPETIKDSLNILVKSNDTEKEFVVKLKKFKEADSLKISAINLKKELFIEDYKLKFTTPIKNINKDKIKFIKKDSSEVKFTTEVDNFNQEIKFIFDKTENESYDLKLFPGAVEDVYERKNDTLKFNFKWGAMTDFGNLKLKFTNIKKFPFVVEILSDDTNVLSYKYCEKETEVYFEGIKPSLYTVRIYYDDNKNRIWDTGDYLNKIQPEEMIYFPGKIDVRANWDVDQEFELNK